ncbi:alkene reductase [Pseudarthrobacter phenanthrenivorans]|uniref:alkene reductase n=1 Tax=Pseudarthrobacter phenanthrenivorans TaxID=361575 RepID=UPI00345104B0
MTQHLFETVQVGGQFLPNRIVLPPLTRSRATNDGVPTALMAKYYGQRSGAGLIVAEGTVVSPQGSAYARVPGLYSDEQVEAWKPVVKAAKSQGAAFYAQLWHVGRQAHSSLQPDGQAPWAPSPIPIKGWDYRMSSGERVPYETPREFTREGIKATVEDFVSATKRAFEAGFDGVEIHAANGYLFDQFLNASSNQRTDEYGGSVENRLRFLKEVLDRLSEEVPMNRVGLRLSPSSSWMDIRDPDKFGIYSETIRLANNWKLAYLHLVEPGIEGGGDAEAGDDWIPSSELSALFDGPVIVTGGHTAETAAAQIRDGVADLVGFGRLFISNPDLPHRFREGIELQEMQAEGLYADDEAGYSDYPAHPSYVQASLS